MDFYLDENFTPSYKNSKVVILPVCYEKTTSALKGTENAPSEIIFGSGQLEEYDDELDCDIPFNVAYTDHGLEKVNDLSVEKAFEEIRRATKKYIEDKKFVFALGGEHTISIPLIEEHSKHFKNLSVLHFDAHADLRDKYLGDKYSHACAMRRSMEYVKTIVSLGIRNYSREERELIKGAKLNVFNYDQSKDLMANLKETLNLLSDNVYLTIDADGFDTSVIRGLGTPEIGGFMWYEFLSFIKEIIKAKNIVGADLVEYCPQNASDGTKLSYSDSYALARLVHKIIGYRFFMKRGGKK